MAEESSGIDEAVHGRLRVTVAAGRRVGKAVALGREHAMQRAQVAGEEKVRELSSRLEAERRAARDELGNVCRADWWDRATPEQVGSALATALAWWSDDPEAVRAEGRIRDELRMRYDIDIDDTGADRNTVQAEFLRTLPQGAAVSSINPHFDMDAHRGEEIRIGSTWERSRFIGHIGSGPEHDDSTDSSRARRGGATKPGADEGSER